MKILFGMPEKTARGGINACEPPFLNELEKTGIEIHEELYGFNNPKGISNAKRALNVIKTAQRWQQVISKEQFDLIHLNTAFDKNAVLRDSFVLFFLKNKKPKVFLKFHGSDANLLKTKSPTLRFLWTKTLEKVAAIGVLSLEEKENFVRAGVSEKKIFVVKNVVSDFSQNNISGNFDVSKGKPLRMLFVSRLLREKGLIETVEACNLLQAKGLSFTLDVLGEGEALLSAKDLTVKYNLQNRINFRGHIAEEIVRKYYQESDLLVFPTFHQEGFPMVIFNAMAHGLPLVTTKIRAAADYLENGVNCLFCEAKNPQDVADKIEILYRNPNLRKKMSENNTQLARKFSAEEITTEYLEIYRQIVNS